MMEEITYTPTSPDRYKCMERNLHKCTPYSRLETGTTSRNGKDEGANNKV